MRVLSLRRAAAAATSVGCGWLTSPTHAANEALPPTADQAPADASFRRHESDPLPPDAATAHRLVEQWTQQERTPGYTPAQGSWPELPPRSVSDDLSSLRRAFESCGGKDHLREGPRSAECNDITFRLAVALLGGTLYGHRDLDDAAIVPTEDENAEGADLMRHLADAGSTYGLCGWAFLLHCGEFVEEDAEEAAEYHRRAAMAGFAQSMHELGTMHYLGDGLPEDCVEAVRWFRMAAEKGVSGSMYLLAECMYSGEGTHRDVESALGWFAAAGQLGHRGARSRIASAFESRELAWQYRGATAPLGGARHTAAIGA